MGLEARSTLRRGRRATEGDARLETAAIRNPKPLIDKLGVKPGMTLSVIGDGDAAFLRQARGRADSVAVGRAARDSDLVFFFTDSASELKRLPKLRDAIRPNGAVWVVWPKGRPALKEDHVRAAAIQSGLVDVKVVAFSSTHSALKLMIRVKDR